MGERFDVIVIGAGPGGYVAAIKCAKAGLRTAIVENRRVGGTCLNRGCIPAKAMIHASSLYREMQGAEKFGVSAEGIAFDYEKIVSYKEETTEKLCQGIEQLLKGNGVTILCGKGSLEQEHKVKVTGEESEEYYDAEHVILAAGSKPVILPIPGLELPGVLTSDELFRLKEMPESLVIIGGGVISVEFASVYANLGCKVTIVEAMPRLIPNMDKEISQNLKMILKKRGVDIHTSASVQRVEQEGELYTCVFTEKEQEVRVSAKYVLCAIGRCPNTEGLFGEGVSPEMERGRIVVDENFQSSLPNVYAIGDLVKGMQLAHLASAQGMYVAEILAKEKGLEIKTGKFIMSANGKSLITKEERGFIKIVAEKETDVILGAQMMCARATDMIGELVTAMTNRMTVQQLLRGMRAHPTYNEGVQEALEEILGGAVHVMPKKKPAK